MTMYRFPDALRSWIIAALPEDTSLHGGTPEANQIYLPATHAKALHPNSMLIEGIRGSGKSFWWAALQSARLRALMGGQTSIDAGTVVSIGFGERSSPNDFPGKDTLVSLVNKKIESRRIWQTVVFKQVVGDHAPQEFKRQGDWGSRIQWVHDHPEVIEQCLFDIDALLDSQGHHHLVLFDALDRTADDWQMMNALVRGLLQIILDFRSYKRIRVKVFARPDQLEEESVRAFPDSSKVFSQKMNLDWPRRELYGLLWQYLSNDNNFGQFFRDGCGETVSARWEETDGIWLVPDLLRSDEEVQKKVFHAMSGPWMGRDRRRGFPYSWLPGHLSDARGQVSPRSFLAAVRRAAQDKQRSGQEFALHYESIKRGVQEASKIRVSELEEDYPWIKRLFQPLSGISVPCLFTDIQAIWDEKRVLAELEKNIVTAIVRLPPARIAIGPEGVLQDLMDLGLVERLKDQRINLPDVYRVGYGMGRRGGIKPIGH